MERSEPEGIPGSSLGSHNLGYFRRDYKSDPCSVWPIPLKSSSTANWQIALPSRIFYRDWGFEETGLMSGMSVFKTEAISFYLQDAYVRDWIDNTMVFLEMGDVRRYWNELLSLDLTTKYEGVRLTPIKEYDWGRECFIHNPSGILWHIGEFFEVPK